MIRRVTKQVGTRMDISSKQSKEVVVRYRGLIAD